MNEVIVWTSSLGGTPTNHWIQYTSACPRPNLTVELLSETLCVKVLHAQTSSIYAHHNWQTISINTLVVV